jgi:hypothetical protein
MSRRLWGGALVLVALGSVLVFARATGSTATAAPAPPDGPVRPRRVLLIGDSIMTQGGPAAKELLERDGVVVRLDGVPGSAPIPLAGFPDWRRRAAADAAEFRPDTAVVLFTGNYTRIANLHDEPDLCRAWGSAVRDIAVELRAAGATRVVIAESVPGVWLLSPDQVFACESAAVAGMRGVEVVDAGGVLGAIGQPRTRVEALPACDGGPAVTVRTPDIHVTPLGGARLGRRIASIVDPYVTPPPPACADRYALG